MDGAALVALLASGHLAERCTTEACGALLSGVAGLPFTLGATQSVGAGSLVRADAAAPGGWFSVWVLVDGAGGLTAASSREDPASLMPAGVVFQVERWATEAAADPAGRCAPGVDLCADLGAQLRGKQGTLRPLATYARDQRRVALLDFVVGGEARDRVWMYAEGDAAGARVTGLDESDAHAGAWLAGELPANTRAPLPASPPLVALATPWCAGAPPTELPPLGPGACSVAAGGAVGTWGAVCLALPTGDHLVVQLRKVDGSWKPGTWSYGLDCALTVGSLLR